MYQLPTGLRDNRTMMMLKCIAFCGQHLRTVSRWCWEICTSLTQTGRLSGTEGESHKMVIFLEDNYFSEMITEPTQQNSTGNTTTIQQFSEISLRVRDAVLVSPPSKGHRLIGKPRWSLPWQQTLRGKVVMSWYVLSWATPSKRETDRMCQSTEWLYNCGWVQIVDDGWHVADEK